jgi:hypothetical protein
MGRPDAGLRLRLEIVRAVLGDALRLAEEAELSDLGDEERVRAMWAAQVQAADAAATLQTEVVRLMYPDLLRA